jgi:hypothetical protein
LNVYGPNQDEERPSFFHELKELDDQFLGPWMIAGDFNSVLAPHERSTSHMSPNENLFNDYLADLLLHEIPFLDRNYTWSNMHPPPFLVNWTEFLSTQIGIPSSQTALSLPFLGPRQTTIPLRLKSSQIFQNLASSDTVTIGFSN